VIYHSRAHIGSWKVTSRTGAVTTIYDVDGLKPISDFRDYDPAKLSVSAPLADPTPLPKDTDPTGARRLK